MIPTSEQSSREGDSFMEIVNPIPKTTPSMLDGSYEPGIPTEIWTVVCSNAPIREKRAVVENAILTDSGFVLWAVNAMYNQHTPEEKAELRILVKDGRGFSKWDSELLAVAANVGARGYVTGTQLAFCREPNKKGRSRLGKYAIQLIALVMAEFCLGCLTPRLARLLPPIVALEKEAA